MSTISDASSASLARAFEAVQRPEISEGNAHDALLRDGGGVSDCFPPADDLGPDYRIEPFPDDIGPCPGPVDDDPVTTDIFQSDREPFIDDKGQIGWRTVVKGTSHDDTIKVVYNADGSADVTINGETTQYSAEEARNMRISGGAGDDTITVTDNRGLCGRIGSGDITVEGGSGDDNISGDLNGVNADGGTGSDTVNGMPELDFDFDLPIDRLPLDRPIEAKPFELEEPVYTPV